MIRLIGILIGAALAIATLILLLGLPQLAAQAPGPAIEPERPDRITASENARQRPDAAPDPALPAPEPASSDAAMPATADTPPPAAGENGQALIEQVFAPEETREIIESAAPEPIVEENWYAFWSPFRTQLAADGFVAKLQESTGLDYRVVRIRTGVYEVAFAYTDDADIQAKLDRIAAATGLDMSGG